MELALKDTDGNPVFARLRGEVVLLNYWASWLPCRNAYWTHFIRASIRRFTLIAINVMKAQLLLLIMLKSMDTRFPLV